MTSVEVETIESDMTKATASPYFNRELSWLEFNRRVLEEAMDERHPLLERVKFLSIFSTNLDEFFMIRVAGLKQQVAAGVVTRSPDGMTPAEQLAAIRRAVIPLIEQHRACWLDDIRPKLCQQGIHVLDYHELTPEQRAQCTEYFEREVFPVLTPLAIDPAHPFPHISNLSLNLAVVINDPEEGELFARVKVPAVLPRFVPIEGGHCDSPEDIPPERRHCFTWLEQVITANVSSLFPGEDVVECYLFRITRNADMEIEEEEADDLLRVIEEGVRQRRFGAVVRLQVQPNMPERVRSLLLHHLKLTPDDVYEMRGPLGLSDLMQLTKIDRPDLKDPPFYPVLPAPLQHARSSEEIFAAIRQHDILLHHPFHSFQPLVTLIEAAAEDPNVLAIKQTLYRVGSNSPIVKALMHAREQDKQVTVLVELKARFDEENNIIWAKQLERSGVHVVYGLVGLKTHAKLALIVRREHDGLRRYVHLGTGNYNATTARIYTDLGLLTARPDIAADVSELFNHLTGYSRQRHYRKLLVAPVSMRECLERLIEREIGHAQAGRPARLIFKCNSLVDKKMIDLLYRASQAGVTIDLIVRGICCLRPGAPGMSERITVRSIVGRFLEHSRIYYFENDGNPDIYLGSADLMERNLDRRVETLFPIETPALKEEIRHLLGVYLRDTSRARILMPDGSYVRARPRDGEEPFDSQAFLSRENMMPR
ncbi:MAG: polyphosphate kinase 1 [Roseiflexus sp.]|nr:polyphosphate kinase 1 [Roseiflexus sp.]MCS7288748.1 polyphosphate kinase 1 [Roseiflexus sp.]MDW8233589.1 polyphosphate kinase 1 [Roseiflexaceae bacterium]